MTSAAYVLNPYYSGLGIARSLHESRIPVYALYSAADAPARHSRLFTDAFKIPDTKASPEAAAQALLRLADANADRGVLFPTRDFDVKLLCDYRQTLSKRYALAVASDQALAVVTHKERLAAFARSLDLAAPRSFLCDTRSDVDAALAELTPPVILKPDLSYEWHQDERTWRQVGGRKAVIADSLRRVYEEFDQLRAADASVLVQEFVDGKDADVVVCGCFVGASGKLLGYFTARKLRQSPPLTGTGCLLVAEPIPTIVEYTQRLLNAAGYEGLAEAEYKLDRRTGRYVLIEINTRHWDQHELGRCVGVNLSWLAYRSLTGHQERAQFPTYDKARPAYWIAERELLIQFVKDSQIGDRGYGFLSMFRCLPAMLRVLLNSRTVFAIVSISDPLPGVLLVARLLRGLAASAIRRSLRLLKWRSASGA